MVKDPNKKVIENKNRSQIIVFYLPALVLYAGASSFHSVQNNSQHFVASMLQGRSLVHPLTAMLLREKILP